MQVLCQFHNQVTKICKDSESAQFRKDCCCVCIINYRSSHSMTLVRLVWLMFMPYKCLKWWHSLTCFYIKIKWGINCQLPRDCQKKIPTSMFGWLGSHEPYADGHSCRDRASQSKALPMKIHEKWEVVSCLLLCSIEALLLSSIKGEVGIGACLHCLHPTCTWQIWLHAWWRANGKLIASWGIHAIYNHVMSLSQRHHARLSRSCIAHYASGDCRLFDPAVHDHSFVAHCHLYFMVMSQLANWLQHQHARLSWSSNAYNASGNCKFVDLIVHTVGIFDCQDHKLLSVLHTKWPQQNFGWYRKDAWPAVQAGWEVFCICSATWLRHQAASVGMHLHVLWAFKYYKDCRNKGVAFGMCWLANID